MSMLSARQLLEIERLRERPHRGRKLSPEDRVRLVRMLVLIERG